MPGMTDVPGEQARAQQAGLWEVAGADAWRELWVGHPKWL